MGEPHTKNNRLNEKLIASSKVSTNKQNVPTISKTGSSVVIADNVTRYDTILIIILWSILNEITY